MKETATQHFGVHLMLDGYCGNPEKLNDGELVKRCLVELTDRLGMRRIIGPEVKHVEGNGKKDPGGYSAIVAIMESHLTIHTFPAKQFVSIDVYTCQDELDKDLIINFFKEKFELQDVETNYVIRGTKFPVCNLV